MLGQRDDTAVNHHYFTYSATLYAVKRPVYANSWANQQRIDKIASFRQQKCHILSFQHRKCDDFLLFSLLQSQATCPPTVSDSSQTKLFIKNNYTQINQ